ncbi:MAG: ABC transporter substrate-binding protein [Oceanipulchritudo sp.]
MKHILLSLISGTSLLLLCGCGGDSGDTAAAREDQPFKVVLQTDWYAQPEHGGFYQALAEGYYAEEGLEVEILQGGPNALTAQRVAQGKAHFGIGRSDDVIVASGRGVPLIMVGALMQKDPQALMFHEESGIESLADLDGRSVMAGPGSAFLEILKLTYDVDFPVIPLDYGMSRFLADKEFVQQCFITNEPFYVARSGANVKTILLSESGFNPYRVWFTSKSFQRRHPEVVAAFHRASIRGWREYMFGDRTRANALIAERNPKMDADFMEFVHASMMENQLVTGESGSADAIGVIDPERIQTQIDQLLEIDLLENARTVPEVYLMEEAETGEPVSLSPLPVLDADGEALLLIDAEAVRGLQWVRESLPLEAADQPVAVGGVLLGELMESLDLPVEWDLLLADCSDGYQSNYTREVLQRNQPLLILEIDGRSTADWCASRGRPEWGPYMIELLEPGDLLDPVNKNPWGVESLRVMLAADLLEGLALANLEEDAVARGLALFKGNCASCHVLESHSLGGTVSNRSAGMLSALAIHAEDYFTRLLHDPEGTNPAAAKMPAVPHYGPEEIEALLAFLTHYK